MVPLLTVPQHGSRGYLCSHLECPYRALELTPQTCLLISPSNSSP
jgi:hypothetical protein